MRARYNVIFTVLLLAYSIPGLFLARMVPFLEKFLGNTDIGALVAAALLQAAIAFWLFPRIDLLGDHGRLRRYRANHLGVALIQAAYLSAAAFVLAMELTTLTQGIGASDRNSLYRAYEELAEAFPLEKIKTMIAVISIFFVLSGRRRLGIGTCVAISAVDFGFGNRSFLFYTLLVFIFSGLARNPSLKTKWFIALVALFMLGRTYIFSGDIDIEGADHFLAVFGEFVFTSSAPLFVTELSERGDMAAMVVQLLGLDKLTGARAMWVGEIIQKDLAIPIGLACGPVCDIYYYSGSSTLSLLVSTVGIALLYAAFLWLTLTLNPGPKRLPIVLVQALLFRDIIRTGLILSLSTLILWTAIAVLLSHVFFAQRKDDPFRSSQA